MAESGTAAGGPLPPLKEALGWIGIRVDDLNGTRVGSVEAVYVDARGGEPVWVIVKLGRFGKVTAVPFADCAGGPGRLWVAHARKAVRGAPAVSAGQPLTREDELELCDYYRVHPDRGRAAEVTSRPEEAATAEPVAEAG